jgi:hypothetical protein
MKVRWIAIVAVALVFAGVAAHAMEDATQPDGGGLCWICRLLQ